MSDNPYAPPGARLERPFDTQGSGSFEIGRCLSEAWSATWANFPLWLGAMIVSGLAAMLATITVIGFFLVLPVLVWGAVYFGLRMYDGRAEFRDVFAGFSRYGTALLTTLALMVLLFLVGLVGQSVQLVGQFTESEAVYGVGVLVNLAFALFVTSRLNLAYFFVVDAGLPATEALSRAWEVTRGSVFKVAGLVLLGIPIMIAGFLALVVGAIPAFVIVYLMWVSAYRQLVGTPAAA